MTETDRYKQAWQDRRSRLFALVAMILVSLMSLRLWPGMMLVVIGCFVGLLVAAYRFYQFACPRCRERFMASPKDDLKFWARDRCPHCDLEKGALPKEIQR